MDGGVWWAAVHGVTKSRARPSDFTFTFHFHALEKEMATHSSVLAWRIPGTAEPGGLPSMGSHRVRHDWSDFAAAVSVCKCMYICICFSHSVLSDSVTLWTVAHQAHLSMRFFRWDYWSRLPFPPPGHLPDPGIKPVSPALQADSLPTEHQRRSEYVCCCC